MSVRVNHTLGRRDSSMNKKGFTLVEIMIVVAIIALLAAIAIPNLMRARITANESAAQANLKTISTACETFAAALNGEYPAAETDLTDADPPFLNRAYDGESMNGYDYAVTYGAGGYTATATPISAATGTHTYTITTGGILTES